MDEGERYILEVFSPEKRRQKRLREIRISLLLAGLTLLTTTFVGAIFKGVNPFGSVQNFLKGLPYAITLMIILGSHEMGHYFTAKKFGVPSTPPFFIPVPFFLGTFGAFIKMKGPVYSRRGLLRIGLSGPLVGFISSTIAMVIGIKMSQIKALPPGGGITLGEPLMFKIVTKIVMPSIPEGKDIILHPIAFAGWIGFLVTAMNLLPIGQLDGGHVFSSIFPGRSRLMSKIAITALLLLGIFYWPGWLVWGALNLILGISHPPVPFQEPLEKWDYRLGIIALLILILSFTPQPVKI